MSDKTKIYHLLKRAQASKCLRKEAQYSGRSILRKMYKHGNNHILDSPMPKEWQLVTEEQPVQFLLDKLLFTIRSRMKRVTADRIPYLRWMSRYSRSTTWIAHYLEGWNSPSFLGGKRICAVTEVLKWSLSCPQVCETNLFSEHLSWDVDPKGTGWEKDELSGPEWLLKIK